MTTEHVTVRGAARWLGVKGDAPSAPWRGSLDGGAYMQSGAAEDGKGKIRQRSVRWMELWWKDTMTAAREEARTEDVLEMLRALVEDSQRGVQARAFLMRWESLW